MSTYLDDYGSSEGRRAKLRNRILGAVVVLALASGGAYYFFRNYKEEQQARLFISHLRNKQYEQAYRTWGCTGSKPCRDYSFEKFLEDWGPQSAHADLSRMEVTRTRSCSHGIIQTLRFGEKDEVLLWVDRSDLTLGFAPWPICDPKIPSGSL
jgi:hypothetical protein